MVRLIGQLPRANTISSPAGAIETPYSILPGNEIIPGELLNVSTLKRDEASNMILFYKQMLVSTRTLQLNNYMVTNREILEELRRTYKLSSE